VITSKIKRAVKLKTSPARLAQLLQPSLAFCFSLQPMTAHVQCAVIGCKLKQNANEGCSTHCSCASLAGLVLSFVACFILLVIAPLPGGHRRCRHWQGCWMLIMMVMCCCSLVVCNLYPFSQTVKAEDVTIDDAVEQIDIGIYMLQCWLFV